MQDQLRRTAVAWSFAARPDEECVLWDLDVRAGVPLPWSTGAPAATVSGSWPAARPARRLAHL